MVKALENAKQQVSPALRELAQGFAQKLEAGLVKYGSHSGYTKGKGYKFDEEEAKKKFKEQQRQRRSYGLEEDRDSEEEDEEDRKMREAAGLKEDGSAGPSSGPQTAIQQQCKCHLFVYHSFLSSHMIHTLCCYQWPS